jgi:hypothetical protein
MSHSKSSQYSQPLSEITAGPAGKPDVFKPDTIYKPSSFFAGPCIRQMKTAPCLPDVWQSFTISLIPLSVQIVLPVNVDSTAAYQRHRPTAT